jgi:hypothetical protein
MTEYVTIPAWWLVAFPVAWMVGGTIVEVVNAVVVRPWATRRMHERLETAAARLVVYWKKRALEAERKKEAVG